MPTIILVMGGKRPKTDAYMTHLKKKNIYKVISQKLRKKYVYETDIHNIYNIIVGQKKHKLQDNA